MRTRLLLLAAVLAAPAAAAPRRNVLETVAQALASDRAYDDAERARILDALKTRFADYGLQVVSGPRAAAVPVVLHVITEGSFDQEPPERMADAAFAAYQAVSRGAPPEVVEGIALYGYRKRIPGERIAAWANGYRQMTENAVPGDVAADLVHLAMEKDISDGDFDILKWALVDGAKRGFDSKAYATWLLGHFAQDPRHPGALSARAVAVFLEARRRGVKPELPPYQGIFIPPAAPETPRPPLPVKPSPPTPEIPPSPAPIPVPAKPSAPSARKPAPAAPPERIVALWPELDSVARSYLGTPYVWGGNTHAGIDCSGLTHNTYGENRVRIPRVSRDQYKMEQAVRGPLREGDLVFFNTLGVGVSHVGMVVDPDKGLFIQASSSKGVSYARLDNRYYKPRYLGARRVIP